MLPKDEKLNLPGVPSVADSGPATVAQDCVAGELDKDLGVGGNSDPEPASGTSTRTIMVKPGRRVEGDPMVASHPAQTQEQAGAPKKGSCCERCVGKSKLLYMTKKVCGRQLPAFIGLLAMVVTPTLDASSDWAVAISWYRGGDNAWFKAALVIQLISGTLNGLLFGGVALRRMCYRIDNHPGNRNRCVWLELMLWLLVGLLLGIAGLAPAAYVAMLLLTEDQFLSERGSLDTIAVFKWTELVFETLPQSMLQVYVGVTYGTLNPSNGQLDYVLAVSVLISFLSAGFGVAGFETINENDVSVSSRAGILLALQRSSQIAAMVFWIALLGCAQQGLATLAVCITVVVLILTSLARMAASGVSRPNDKDGKLRYSSCIDCEHVLCGCCCCGCCCAGFCARQCKVGILDKAVDTGDIYGIKLLAAKCHDSSVGLCGLVTKTVGSAQLPIAWGCVQFMLVAGFALFFFTVEHVDNNYLNVTLPVAGPGSPQHYDCHERKSSIYSAIVATAASLLLFLPALLTDPHFGWRPCQSRELTWNESNENMVRKLREQSLKDGKTEEQIEEEIFEAKVLAIWRYANLMGGDHLEPAEMARLADACWQRTYKDVCIFFGVTPQRMDDKQRFFEDEGTILNAQMGPEAGGVLTWTRYNACMSKDDNRKTVNVLFTKFRLQLIPKSVLAKLLCGC